jgi:hypothetical protein
MNESSPNKMADESIDGVLIFVSVCSRVDLASFLCDLAVVEGHERISNVSRS